MLYGEFRTINSNVCMCEDFLGGTQRPGKKGARRCKRCGFDRPGAETYRSIRRSLSEESVSAVGSSSQDPYEYMRKRRLVYPKPVFYDEQDEYEDIMFDDSTTRSDLTTTTVPHLAPASMQPPGPNKNFTRTQSMNLNNNRKNNNNKLNTKDSKDIHNIAIRSSPLRAPPSSTGNKNVVTVNGVGKNSSIIYLSSEASPPKRVSEPDYSDTNSISINTSTPIKQANPSSANVSPYDLIKKYVEDTPPNSLSDSNLSSDGGLGGDQNKIFDDDKSGSEFSDSDSDEHNGIARYNSFKISGQKIQIYSDCSVRQDYSSCDSDADSEGDADSEYSNYDADCSVVESPRLPSRDHIIRRSLVQSPSAETTKRRSKHESQVTNTRRSASPPIKPPRRKSSEKEIVDTVKAVELLEVDEAEDCVSRRLGAEMSSLPRSNSGSRQPFACNPKVMISRKISSDSQRSLTSRSKSFSGSRDSLFGSVDFKHFGISKNFSSEIIQELYGSKTSLLKNIELQNERRRQQGLLLSTEGEPVFPRTEGYTPEKGCMEGDSGHYDVPTEISSVDLRDKTGEWSKTTHNSRGWDGAREWSGSRESRDVGESNRNSRELGGSNRDSRELTGSNRDSRELTGSNRDSRVLTGSNRDSRDWGGSSRESKEWLDPTEELTEESGDWMNPISRQKLVEDLELTPQSQKGRSLHQQYSSPNPLIYCLLSFR